MTVESNLYASADVLNGLSGDLLWIGIFKETAEGQHRQTLLCGDAEAPGLAELPEMLQLVPHLMVEGCPHGGKVMILGHEAVYVAVSLPDQGYLVLGLQKNIDFDRAQTIVSSLAR